MPKLSGQIFITPMYYVSLNTYGFIIIFLLMKEGWLTPSDASVVGNFLFIEQPDCSSWCAQSIIYLTQ